MNHALALLLAAACAPPPPLEVDPGFVVVGSSPEDGTEDVVESHLPELRFNEVSDPDTCTTSSVRLDALHEDDTVAFAVEADLERVDDGVKLRLAPYEPMPNGWWYALTVRDGADGCTSVGGDAVRPFRARFFVP